MINNFLIEHNKSIKEALILINDNARGIAFVTKNKKLVGIVTDGDIRRCLIAGLTINSIISEVQNNDFVSLNINSSKEKIIKIFKEGIGNKKNKKHKKITCIPLVNNSNEIVDLAFNTKEEHIPVFEPNLLGNEQKYLISCLKSNWISSKGPYINEFEKMFESLHDGYKALAVSSGTTALHLALIAQNIGPGDEVIVPNLTFAASINTIIHSGATPVIVDVDQNTWTINPVDIKEVISKKTKAIMPVHLFGHSCEMDSIVKIAKDYNLKIIEDCAEAIGTKYKSKRVGTFGDSSAFSFFGNKTITTGEGGMVLFNNEECYEKAKILRDHGMSPTKRYWHEIVGYNYRMTNMQAAVGVAQTERLNETIKKKRKIAENYNKNLSKLKSISLPIEEKWCHHTYWAYGVLLKDNKLDVIELEQKLKKNGVEIRPFFSPLSEQPPYRSYRKSKSLNNSILLAKKGFCLPSSVNLNDSLLEKVCRVLSSIISLDKIVKDF